MICGIDDIPLAYVYWRFQISCTGHLSSQRVLGKMWSVYVFQVLQVFIWRIVHQVFFLNSSLISRVSFLRYSSFLAEIFSQKSGIHCSQTVLLHYFFVSLSWQRYSRSTQLMVCIDDISINQYDVFKVPWHSWYVCRLRLSCFQLGDVCFYTYKLTE